VGTDFLNFVVVLNQVVCFNTHRRVAHHLSPLQAVWLFLVVTLFRKLSDKAIKGSPHSPVFEASDTDFLFAAQIAGKKTTKLWVPDDEVSPETLAKVRRSVNKSQLQLRFVFCHLLFIFPE